jgi:branched-chain amino acid transport system substrate-binding protein
VVLLYVVSGFILIMLAGLVTGCAKKPVLETEPGLTGEELALAERLYGQLVEAQMLQRDRKTLELAYELIDHYPQFERNDEVTLRAMQSAQRLDDLTTGRQLATEFLARYPTSALLADALAVGVELAVAADDTADAADLLIRKYDAVPDGTQRDDVAQEATRLCPALKVAELDTLVQRHPRSGLRPYLSFLLTEGLLAEGRIQEAGQAVDALTQAAPESDWLTQAELLLTQPGYRQGGTPLRLQGATVLADRIGGLCPLTGRYSVLGNAFYDGMQLAVDMINGEGWRQYSLSVEDTEGDPVMAAIAARKLATETGPIAVIGAMLSDPTIAAAIVMDTYGIPLISPTATNERIWELGPAVFQTNLTGDYEAGLLAQIATRLLLKKRFAVLYPDNRDGIHSYQVFAEEVRAYGGEVVGAASFSPAATDFRQPILELRRRRPEVVFIPATVDQMILLGPQLDFYQLSALVLGLSNWNSPRIFQQSGTALVRMLFPSDQVLFPQEWTDYFQREWQAEHLPPEATALALKTFQATCLVLDSLAREDIQTRQQLAEALTRRIHPGQLDSTGPWSIADAINASSEGEITLFPADLFLETWEFEAVADTTADRLDPALPATDQETPPVEVGTAATPD